ncbi:sensor histidine kinase [Thiosulfativibrio zosterae]|uniref:histidine kinase n=1 Tax=Thiosulfativibrio zosterae TaxID=2675053 RepID=A0A6F8PML4_9GAMM|nr:sensor histidine kinase [Thiosulfativibrio zosterae]BBP43351.1 sensor histidine kinase [Thiosulfativibrio zosterae]
MKSLEKQLSSSMGLSLVVLFGLFWWVSITAIHKVTEQYIVTRLEHDTESIIKHLIWTGQSWHLEQEISPIYSQVHSGHYFVIKTPHNNVTSNSLENYPLFAKAAPKQTLVYETKGPKQQLVLVLSTQARIQNQPIQIWVAEDHSPIQQSLFTFDMIFGGFSLVILITIFGLQRYWLKRGFSQLKPLESALIDLQDDKIIHLNSEDYPNEISGLIKNLNQAFSNAKAQLEKSRHANANLAHTLKTPLNIIYQLLDNPILPSESREALQQQAQTIYRLLERELKKARIAADAVQTARLNAQHLQDLVSSLQTLYPNIQIDLKGSDEAIRQLGLDQEDGYELFGNLLDNACKWAQHQVNCHIQSHASGVVIIIEDDGPGVAPAQLAKIQERGYRLDEQQSGQGLGLAIVADLVSAYQAHIQFSSPKTGLGGLKVTVIFEPHKNAPLENKAY